MRQVLGYSGFMRDQFVDFERPQAKFLACFGVFIVARESDLAAGACRVGGIRVRCFAMAHVDFSRVYLVVYAYGLI